MRVVDTGVVIAYYATMVTNRHPIAFVEQFHLLFLDQLGRKLDKRCYALKGGSNLRFYMKSIRYSEDIDLDVQSIAVDFLQDRVERILTGSALINILQSRHLAIARYSASKQTETTQRWKLTLSAKDFELPLHTKIEFSRRGIGERVVLEPVDALLMRKYQITPFLSSHYPPEIAFQQKINALIHRSETQARDIFDLDHLLRFGVSTMELDIPDRRLAQQNAMSVPYDVFRSQVLAFLAPEYQAQYDSPEVWDDMALRVAEALKGGSS